MGFLHTAEFVAVGDMDCIRLKKEDLVYQQGLQGAEFRGYR